MEAKYYYEKAANLNYSDAFIMLGDIYYYGYGVEQDYLKSKDFYEKSSDSDNAEGLVKLGDLYYHGYGVKQDYLKAKDYYEKAANFNYTKAFNKLGDIYYYGYGVEQNYLKSRDFYAKSSDSNDSYAHFCLGDLYSNNEKFEVDFQKAINYFMKSINIQRGEQIVSYIRADNITQISFNPNNYRYISYNDLGLINLIELKERNDANKYLKESFYAEYPFGQNNFGLYNQFYLIDQNKHENVKYMFERSSQHKFSLAEFNLGILYENENDIEKSIEYFIRASEHENEPLIYRDIRRVDKRLEISKLFIICLVDFKLIDYYFLQNNFGESKKYFIKLINRLKFNSKDSIYPFKFKIQCENENKEKLLNNLFSYLKRFVFNFPLFNLINQPNLDLNKYSDIFSQNNENEFQDETTSDKNAESTINTNDEKNENNKYLKEKTNDFDKQNDSYLMKKSSIIVDYLNKQSKDENIIKINNKNVNIFTDPSELFDFIVEETNPKIVTIFINEIKMIINDMKDILYTPPYPILFGRIHITKKNSRAKLENRNEKRKSVGKSFYDGFDLELDN
ncbi:hypothetical protein M9Y10_025134 [Tritrichomonas musculus]|uniref:Uncharacterized protein n=1 Tax=Tritrichomonas musculus TaxID=1915356 RepID=A0ABR2HBP1_9EUKA